MERRLKVNKKASWTTSGGFADFYVVQTTSPDFKGYDDLSVFVIDGEHVKAQPSLWDALGLRGNQSGPIQVDGIEIPADQIVGPIGDGAASNDEAVDPWFLVGSSSVWNGITLERSTSPSATPRASATWTWACAGMADYPTIQDYVGEAVMDTNACRVFVYSVAEAMDRATDNNTRIIEVGETARADLLHWAWQIKFEAAKNTAKHVDKMLHACGGSGYKRDMELERYVRDAKAGWVMGPTNEVLRSSWARRCCSVSRRSTTGTSTTTGAWWRTRSRSSTRRPSVSWPSSSWSRPRRTRPRSRPRLSGRESWPRRPLPSRWSEGSSPSTAPSSRGGCAPARPPWWSCAAAIA